MAEEISNQTQDLPSFASQLRKTTFPKLKPSKLKLAASGDSYPASVFAQQLSQSQAVASDPYELLTNIKRTRGKTLVIVSVSGRTRTNVELARKAKDIATNRIAITANSESPLAKECDETLQLKYRTTGILTSGTVSFTTSLLACAFLLGSLPRTIQVKTTLTDNVSLATNLKQSSEGSFLFTGSGVNYALSLYGAAKINEVLGAKAEAAYPEQLGHAKLFTIDKRRDVIVCISSGRDKARATHELLRKHGFRSILLTISKRDVIDGSLQSIVHLQQLVLALAKKRGIQELEVLSDTKRLRLSDKMIY